MAPKAGLKTTEFWMHLILQVILLLNTINVWDYMPARYTVLVQGILGAAYAASRGVAKISPPSTTGAASMAIQPVQPPGDSSEPPA